MSSPHVLITRPDPEACQLALLAEQNGLQPIVLPAMAFRPRAAGMEFDRFWKPGVRKLAIFCSPRAVDFGVRVLPAGFLDGVELAAIGPASANRLEAARSVYLAKQPYMSGFATSPNTAIIQVTVGRYDVVAHFQDVTILEIQNDRIVAP